jgi:hypothetical protein
VSFRSFALLQFWKCYDNLPENIRKLADQKYETFKNNPYDSSLGLQRKGEVWTVDIGRSYRAVAYREGNEFHWFWIGPHGAYDTLLTRYR